MTMTKKHFKAIAEILSKTKHEINYMDELIQELSNYFKTENPNFDEVKFKEACLN